MARTNLLRNLVDRVLAGNLKGFLQERRDAGASYRAIARDLDELHDIDVTAETVRVWCEELDVVAKPAEVSS